MKDVLPKASLRRICRVLEMPRSSLEPRKERSGQSRHLDELLVARIRRLIERHPTFGYRRIWALLRFREGLQVNRKTVYRVLRVKRWFLHQRRVTPVLV